MTSQHSIELSNLKRLHFVAIGGSVMHGLALAFHHMGAVVTGSDDKIFDPSRSRLEEAGLLPEKEGWFADNITPDLDAVIIGLRARVENPELIKAQELGLPIYSFPELMALLAENKTRVAVCGSHGKTTTTAMILNGLKQAGIGTDYLLGAKVDGFDRTVHIDEQAKIAVYEGDEYLSASIDRRPKFLNYKPHIAVITGIAWDHMDVFETEEIYIDQFQQLIDIMPDEGTIIYCEEDQILCDLVANNKTSRPTINWIGYKAHPYTVEGDHFTLNRENGETVPLQIFGQHNMMNLQAAHEVLKQLTVPDDVFYQSIAEFGGADRRLTLLENTSQQKVFFDFAHAPSKVKATVNAVRELHPDQNVLACVELHTWSSLNKDFLPHYQNALDGADTAIVYFNDESFEWKNIPAYDRTDVHKAFGREDIIVMNDSEALRHQLIDLAPEADTILLMSSGDFDGLDVRTLAKDMVALPKKVKIS